MNKDEVYEIWNSVLSGEDTIFAFASACEKIGMEKAAKICDEYYSIEGIAQKCAEVIRKAT